MSDTSIYPTRSFREFLTRYEHHKPQEEAPLTVLYIHGLASNPWGRKPEAVKSVCEQLELNFYRFELLGHGIDAANYEKTDLDLWKEQILDIIDHHITGNFIIVGHCIGGWLGLMAAQERGERLKGIVCTSTAPNLVELMDMQVKPEQRQELESNGKIIVKIERMVFTFTRSFIASGLKNAILNQPDIPITCPVHLIQGLKDTFIDWRVIFRIAAKLRSDKVAIKLLKNSNHHLQHPLDLEEINNSLRSIVEAL